MRRSAMILVATFAFPALCLGGEPAVHGAGTPGKVPLWIVGQQPNKPTLGDSILTQSTSMLSVAGLVEATLFGFKFPDGTVQATAAVTGLQSIAHDPTLTGAGTTAAPLGLSVPLHLAGNLPFGSVVHSFNSGASGSGLSASGGVGIRATGLILGAGGSESGIGVIARG